MYSTAIISFALAYPFSHSSELYESYENSEAQNNVFRSMIMMSDFEPNELMFAKKKIMESLEIPNT